ncbi:hypothetical protein PsorP6_013394 [Peronosclerospora sorghi]|uniref:Uncharacterized protein n=1 Tax=Peronosclerospora sorghi TaxID=230839 RepID=A0ACC0WFM0_9STRA|nr:hypothetical protein PsorP6_013394 [Peronosclerospora sorghi]
MTSMHSSLCQSSVRSIASSDSTSSVTAGVAPVSNSSAAKHTSHSVDSCYHLRSPLASSKKSNTNVKPASPIRCGDLSAYYTFSNRDTKIIQDKLPGLSGFLEYRKLNGSWRSFFFQTIGHQLVLYRVHSTHQVLIMSTDIRNASEIALEYDEVNVQEETRLLRLGINGTTIILRAVTHWAAAYWVDVRTIETMLI